MTNPFVAAVETPSGKDTAYENFPVGSWLLPRALRPHIAVFYRFARAIDDIADNPDLPADEKLARLKRFEDALLGCETENPVLETVHLMRWSLAETGVPARHCIDLITAFKQDATKLRYADWDDLMGYCVLSAAPVGRYLLDLHSGSNHGYGPSDALCMALQVINHLQDCKNDYQALDRVYLPADWMAEAGATVEDLVGTASSTALRSLLDRILNATADLLDGARSLPDGLRRRSLAMESAAIIAIADRLIEQLRVRDPLGPRVQLTKIGYLFCCIRGVVTAGLKSRLS
ncbi:MAG: squalene synthase HpnC [Pseudomonadota bacterium]|nr:squalene synthase HpnC [Pseudomonadota bacterium]